MNPYTPDELPIIDIDKARLITLVGKANSALAQYNGLLQAVVNPAILLSPMTNQEAVLSSKIEGTVATIEEVLEHEAGNRSYDEQKSTDIQEIINYRQAMALAHGALEDRRVITLNLLLQLHEILMDSVRGQNKDPGNFRRDQNWIGKRGCSIEEATFVPPSPLQLEDHLRAWEEYLTVDDFDMIAQVAIVHAQFELLHPFKDGNGRIGRLLIPLFLYSKKQLISPMFYLSEYLEANREDYYYRLKEISRSGDWTGWIEFFLIAVIEQAERNLVKTRKIMALYEKMRIKVAEITQSKYSQYVVDTIFDRPIFKISDVSKKGDIHRTTAHGLIKNLIEAGIIGVVKEGAGSKAAIYIFPELLMIADGE